MSLFPSIAAIVVPIVDLLQKKFPLHLINLTSGEPPLSDTLIPIVAGPQLPSYRI